MFFTKTLRTYNIFLITQQKNSPWEGGIRSPTVLWSSLIKKKRRVYDELLHVTDWLPTLLAAAGVSTLDLKLDGINQWPAIMHDLPSSRNELLVNINPLTGCGALIKDGWKLVKGVENADFNGWLSKANDQHLVEQRYIYRVLESDVHKAIGSLSKRNILKLSEASVIACNATVPVSACMPTEYCLFHLDQDKCEYNNVAWQYPQKVNELSAALLRYAMTAHKPENRPVDPNANPAYYNNTWTHWGDLTNVQRTGRSRR